MPMPTVRKRALAALIRRILPPSTLALALVIFALAACLAEAWEAQRRHRANQQIAAGIAPEGAPPMVRFAEAVRLEKNGDDEAALRVYAEVEAAGSPALAAAARMNSANLYLRQAVELASDEDNATRAIVLIELAKTGFRKVLRDDPDAWRARYNLELAQRLVPEYELRQGRLAGAETELDEATRKAHAAWAEMVGTPRGLH